MKWIFQNNESEDRMTDNDSLRNGSISSGLSIDSTNHHVRGARSRPTNPDSSSDQLRSKRLVFEYGVVSMTSL